jgi:hypothetical protein
VPTFEELRCHPNFEDHQVAAGRRVVTCDEALDAWYGQRRVVPNRRGHPAPYLMLGRTSSSRRITVVILPTSEEGLWTAYTAWDTKNSDL